MESSPITKFALYRYRYLISYLLLGVLMVGLLFLNYQSNPPGLSQAEQDSVVASSQVRFSLNLQTFGDDLLEFLRTTSMVDLPYHVLQKLSVNTLGIGPLGVRLPSMLLAVVSGAMLTLMLRRWLQNNVAIVMGILIVTSGWFLGIGRHGTPDVMIVFWTSLILLLSTLISQENKYYPAWKALGLISIGVSLYTPYMIYLFVAGLIASMTQPHLRYLVRYAEKASLSVGSMLFVLILIPLGYHIWREPRVIEQLLAVPLVFPDLFTFLRQFVGELSDIFNPIRFRFNEFSLPLLSVPVTVLVLMGMLRLIRDWHSVRSHVLLLWAAILIPIIGLGATSNVTVLFVPLVLLSAIGVQALIRYWYRLFPHNPYARVFGLIPIGLLLSSIIAFNYQRFFLAMPYATQTVQVHNADAFWLHGKMTSKKYNDQRMVVVVPKEDVPLYKVEKAVAKQMEVVDLAGFSGAGTATSVMVAESEVGKLSAAQRSQLPAGPVEFVVNDRKENALRFRIYQQPQP